MEASAAQGHEGNIMWLKTQFQEAQDTIVQLREAQCLSEGRYAKHSKECEAAEEIARAALAGEKNKQDYPSLFLYSQTQGKS